MIGLALILVSLGVLAFGRRMVARLGRVSGLSSHRLRRLLWLSIFTKLALCLQVYAHSVPLTALLLLASAGLTLLEFGLIFHWLYPVERAQRDLPAARREYLLARLGLVRDAFAPILTFGLGALTLVYLLSKQYRESGVWGVLWASGMGVCALASGLSLSRRAIPLPVRSVPVEAHLLEEAQRLGRELGVQVREILVLDGFRMRSANAFALSGGRIAITDYLLASLTEQETLAVMAHEVAHLAQRRRLIRLWLLTLGMGVAIALALAPLWERLPSWGLLLWLGLLALGMTLPLTRLRQRYEREADDFAVSQYGVTPLQSALRKIATIHPRATEQRGDAVHPTLQQRIYRLEKHGL